MAIVLRRKLAAPIARATDFVPTVMQPDVLRPSQPRYCLHPVIRVPNYMDYYSFTFTTPEEWMAELAALADR